MKILILGGNSYLAKSVFQYLSPKYKIDTYTREELNLLNLPDLEKKLSSVHYDIVMNFAVKGGRRVKIDSPDDFYDNILMQENILTCKRKGLFDKLIIFGSGLEFNNKNSINFIKEYTNNDFSDSYYGFSKYINTKLARNENGVLNLRIFSVFSELEHDHKFIKSNILKYIKKESIEIFSDMYYDFFYIIDFIRAIDYFINNFPKGYAEINCVYEKKYKLSDIANIINSISNYRVPIMIKEASEKNFTGNFLSLKERMIDFCGLEFGIRDMYNKLKNEPIGN